MTLNSITMIQQKVRTDFDILLSAVTGNEAQKSTADQMERHLFKQLLRLGANLLQLYFEIRSTTYPRKEMMTETGKTLPYHSEKSRDYLSIFGELVIKRPYFYAKAAGSGSPLDAELGLGEDMYSDYVRELQEELSVAIPFDKGIAFLDNLLEIDLSKRCVQQLLKTDAADVAAYYEQKPPPPVEEEAPILVAQGDGKGVPIIKASANQAKVRLKRGEARSQKKAVTATAHYTIAPAPRTVDDVLTSLFEENRSSPPTPRSGPQHKQLWGTLAGKEAALSQLQSQVLKREGDHIQHRLLLCDGDPSLQAQLQKQFPHFTLILDFIHVYERLWLVANTLYGQDSAERLPWMREQTRRLLEGQATAVADTCRHLAQETGRSTTQQATLLKAANYYETNQKFMDYATYLAHGWPIASGVIEGVCRHFVKDRLELSGMRWSQDGAENLLHLRAVAENKDWQAYHRFRQQQRQQRLYQRDWPEAVVLPTLSRLAKPATQSTTTSGKADTSTTVPVYAELPLAV
ncbi:MAG: ISKra4 family transposase [Chloroflexi bacterium]|mgnify:CR=1 FL=1|nr:ISKra4 family transposase [Chloroflexota bacterium]